MTNIKTYDKIILIASRQYTKSEITHYNTIDTHNALIVRFNKCSKTQMDIFNGSYHMRFLRGFNDHIGKDFKIYGNVIPDAEFYIYKNLERIKNKNNLLNCCQIDKHDMVAVEHRAPTLGFVAYNILKSRYPKIPKSQS